MASAQRPLLRGLRAVQRLPLSPHRVVGVLDSARDYVSRELEQPQRFVGVVGGQEFAGRPGRTVSDEDDLLAGRWRHVDWPAWRVSLPGGRVVGSEPLILTEDRRALRQSAFDDSHLSAHPAMDGRLPIARHVPGELLVLTGPWSYGWYHWLLDLLPRAALLPLAADSEADVLVPADLTPAQDECLTAVGVPPERRRPYRGGHLQAEELVFPSFVGPTGNPARWALRWLRERLAPAARRGRRRLYISRTDAPERRVANERELVELLDERGFETLTLEGLPLGEQLRPFAEAEVILGPHGAGLANLCAAGTATLIELHRAGQVRPCYFAQANAQGLDYWYLLCESASQDLRVDLGRLERTLDAAGVR